MAKKLGLDSKTGIEIPSEKTGTIAGDKMETWYLGDTLSAAIGQSYNSYTPVEMARYIAALANGGKVNKLTLIKEEFAFKLKKLLLFELNKKLVFENLFNDLLIFDTNLL